MQFVMQLICSRSTRSDFQYSVGGWLFVCRVSDCSVHLLAQLGSRGLYAVISIQQLLFPHFDFLFNCFDALVEAWVCVWGLLRGRRRALYIHHFLVVHREAW